VICPDRETFCRLGERYNLIPVFMTVPADLETPISLYLKLAAFSHKESFLLESGDLGERARYSFIGTEPFFTIYTSGNDTIIQEENKKKRHFVADPLNLLEEVLKGFKVYHPPELTVPFWGGAAGYLSYEMVKRWEKIPGDKQKGLWPECYLYFPRRVSVYDHRQHLLTLIYHATIKGNTGRKEREAFYEQACRKLEEARRALQKNEVKAPQPLLFASQEGLQKGGKKSGNNIVSFFPRQSYISAVNRAKEYIRSGDIFQVVLSRRVRREIDAHPFNIYRALRSLNPSPYQFYLFFPEFQLVGSSPEMLVRLEKGFAYTKPIAGTRPRGRDNSSDLSLAEELCQDEKERAEHMMLVDLGRNDLGKVCRYGSVEVSRLLQIEYYSHVMHLVSEVRGKLRPDCNFADLLRAAFPAGTVSGAPKIRAMEIIAELEPFPRGPYAGAVGYVGFNGDMDTCITIRTIIVSNGQAYLQAGGGIVADSDPDKEYEETEHKMAAPLQAISTAEEWEKSDFSYRQLRFFYL